MFSFLNIFTGLNLLDTSTPAPEVPSSTTSHEPTPVSISSTEPLTDYVKITTCELGSILPIQSIDGELFDVFVLSSDIHDKKVLVKHKILLAILPHQIAEIIRLPQRRGYGQILNVYELQALRKLRYRANPLFQQPQSPVKEISNAVTSSLMALWSSPTESTLTPYQNNPTGSQDSTLSSSQEKSSTYSSPVVSSTTTTSNLSTPSTPLSPTSNSFFASSGLLILELKSGKILKYYCHNPVPCVDLIKRKMKVLGLEGYHQKKMASLSHSIDETEDNTPGSTSSLQSSQLIISTTVSTDIPTEADSIAIANSYLAQTKEIERKFSLSPSIELIEEMMNLFRIAVEQFATIPNTYYHEKVIYTIQQFLIRDDVVQVLDAQKAHSPIISDHYQQQQRDMKKLAMCHKDQEIIQHLTEEVILSPRKVLVDSSDLEQHHHRRFFPASSEDAERGRSLSKNNDNENHDDKEEEDHRKVMLRIRDTLFLSTPAHNDINTNNNERLFESQNKFEKSLNEEEDQGAVDVSKELEHLLEKMDQELQHLIATDQHDQHPNAHTTTERSNLTLISKESILSPEMLAEVEALVEEIQVKDLEKALQENR